MQLCDEIGFDHSFGIEHHFRPDESWMSSPSLYAVGARARTRGTPHVGDGSNATHAFGAGVASGPK